MELCGVKVVTLYDTPHLDKGDRNNLLTKDLKINYNNAKKDTNASRQFVKWEHFDKAFKMDVKIDTMYRNIPKVTLHHIKIGKIKKMKVAVSRQVLSRSMAK